MESLPKQIKEGNLLDNLINAKEITQLTQTQFTSAEICLNLECVVLNINDSRVMSTLTLKVTSCVSLDLFLV